MQYLTHTDLSKLRIKKKAWMREANWRLFICFVDRMADVMPKTRKEAICLRAFAKQLTNLGKGDSNTSSAGPP